MAIATASTADPFPMPENNPAPLEIIAERYRGLTIHVGQYRDADGGERRLESNSKLYYRLNRALEDLVYGLLQHDVETRAEGILDELREIIRREAIRLVVQSGSACWDDPKHAEEFEAMMERKWGPNRAAKVPA